MDRGSIEICRALNLDKYEILSWNSVKVLSRICRGAVENLSMAKSPRWIKKLSRSYRPDRNFLDESRICQETIETNSKKFQWIENAIRSVEVKSPRGSIDRKRSRICRDAVELDKKQFFKERKNTKKWMQTSKLLNQRSNQHFKLSKSSLDKKMQSIHRSKNHTHTLNKSNQFYKNKLRQFSEHTLTHVFLVMAKSHYTYTCIKSSKEFACCVWKHRKSA